MSNTEGFSVAPTNAVDPNAVLPKSIRDASERINAMYSPPASPPQAPQPQPQVTAPVTTPVAAPLPEPPAVVAADPNMTPEQMAHAVRSANGRYSVAMQTVGSLQETLSAMSQENAALQALVKGQLPSTGQTAPPPAVTRLTPEDMATYGEELVDFTKRAALEAVSPELARLAAENERLKKQVTKSNVTTMNGYLDAEVPGWREINSNQDFKNWLRLRDVYSGRVRNDLLKQAYDSGDHVRVAVFFKGFLQEVGGSNPPPTPVPAPGGYAPVPAQTAAVSLESLAAPGRARPASGSIPGLPAEKPIYSHADIGAFWQRVRKGYYANDLAEKDRLERDIFAAAREGRVR